MGSPDSWDAFDEKMSRSKGTVKKHVHNQFLELSSSQNKSLNIADDDFSAFSFQDAKNLIDRDENERLQFMNSNMSFSDGIEQVEAPSLLSVTNYFQQGSSFPVPYVGNDSTMFGASRSVILPPTPKANANDTGRSMRRSSASIRSSSRHSKNSHPATKEDTSTQEVAERDNAPSKVTDLSRNDSLAKFFLGPQSDGLNKMDIMDYVLDYCKRRASLRLSDASDIGRPSSINGSSNSNNTTPERHDSGIGIGGSEKTVSRNDLSGRSEKKDKKVKNNEKENVSTKVESRQQAKPEKQDVLMTNTADNEESVILVNGASVKDDFDVSDVGSIDGFEKFKKNLHTRRKHKDDRFRGKVKHHEEFEKKRLNVDERYSHPRLSPMAFKGPGSSATMERPHKKLPCDREADVSQTHKQSTPREDLPVFPVKLSMESELQQQQTPHCSSNSNSSGSKQSNLPHDALSMVPVIHSAIQQQHVGGNQPCTCPHQCGQQQVPSGLMPTGGLPIVIHIHLPCAPTITGTVAHTVPTSSNEHHKM